MREKNTEHHTNALKNLIIIVFLLLAFLLPILVGVNGKRTLCILSFMLNGLLFIFGIFRAQKKNPFSLELIYWIFMFLFMYFAPIIQYLLSDWPWQGILRSRDILFANAIILLFNVLFIVGGMLAARVKATRLPNFHVAHFLCGSFELKSKSRILVMIGIFLLTVFSLSQTGLMGIIVSRGQAQEVFYSGDNSAVELIVDLVLPAFFAYGVAEAAQEMKSKKKGYGRFIFLFLCLLICFFPTALPRYKMAAIYGTVFIVLFPSIKKGTRFFWLFIFAIAFAFPLMSAFRHVISMENLRSVFEDGFLAEYTTADYDAYRMLSSAITYVRNNGIVWGKQLLGVLLFFVPRSLWATKPEGSGAMLIRHEQGKDAFSNVSCPFLAEGYLNFGIVGLSLFAILLAIIIYKLDTYYWTYNQEDEYNIFSPYLFLIFMVFFLLRGDLLSGFAYLCGFVATGFLLKIIARYIG